MVFLVVFWRIIIIIIYNRASKIATKSKHKTLHEHGYLSLSRNQKTTFPADVKVKKAEHL